MPPTMPKRPPMSTAGNSPFIIELSRYKVHNAEFIDRVLGHKNPAFSHGDQVVGHKNRLVGHKNRVFGYKNRVLGHKNQDFGHDIRSLESSLRS